MTLTAGTRLGAYEIGAALGAGGTGEVYRAVDLALCGLDAWTPAVCRRPVTQRGAVAATTRLWRYSIGYREQMIGSLARTPLRVLANSFFLLEMTAAVDVYGGGD